ncbi:MAG: Ig-like domain-containing protein, partial [Spirochaetota bacterium]
MRLSRPTTHRIGTVSTILIALSIALAGCTNPLQAGLGDRVDIDRPSTDIVSPGAGSYLRGIVTLSGTHADDLSSVPTVRLSFDDGETSTTATVTEDGWSYELDTTAFEDGELDLIVTVIDDSGKESQARQLFYVDNTAPMVLVKNPQGYRTNRYNGLVTVRGEAADRFAIDRVRVRILDENGNALSGFETASGTNSWTFEYDSRLYADPAGSLGIQVEATDRAGNVSTTLLHYDDALQANGGQPVTIEDLLQIASGVLLEGVQITAAEIESALLVAVPVEVDNDLDKPSVSIVSPQNGQNLGGSALLTGTAFDDDGLERVELRIDLNGDGDYDDAFDLNGDGDTTDELETEAAWTTLAGTVLWSLEVNADGELYEVEAGHDGTVAVQVRAVDTNLLVGNPREIALRFDDTIPRVESVAVDGRAYFTGINASGTIVLAGEIRDDEAIDRVRISYNGGISYADLFNRDSGTNDGSITETSVRDLTLSKAIETDDVPGIGSIESGPLSLRLLVVDNAGYQTLSYITINVDNRYPSAAWDTVAADPLMLAGTSALVQGTAVDTGTVSGISAIHVYFVRDTEVYDLSARDSSSSTQNASFSDAGGSPALLPYTPENGASGAPPRFRIEIDARNEFGVDAGPNGDGDGFNESLRLEDNTYTWWARFDSTNIPDGPVEVHYVAFDPAGNGTHYVESGFIRNNPPTLNSLVLGTDLNENGSTADAGERTSPAIAAVDLPDTGFTAVNDLLYVGFNASGGNGTTDYSLVNNAFPGTELVTAGNAFALVDTSGYTDGTNTFTLALTDSVGIEIAHEFTVTVANTDGVAPTTTLDPIGHGSVLDYDTTPQGHFDGSTAPPFDTDPDLSGTFVLTGSSHDNQRIDSLEITIDGFDAGSGAGLPHTVASWNGSTLVASGGLVITDQSLDQSAGHSVSWSYTWNTAEIATVAHPDVALSVTTNDASGLASSSSTVVDVVPYLTRIDTYLAGSLGDSLARSATGVYPVTSGGTITVHGFNLNPVATGAASDVRLSADPDALDAGSNRVGVGLVYTNVATDSTSVDVTVPANGSGYLTVLTNDVPTTNNLNADSSTYNQRPSQTHVLLGDDAELAVWSKTDLGASVSLADNAEYPSMAIRGDVPAFAYVNNSEGYGQARYLLGTTDNPVLTNWDLFTYTSIDFNDDDSHATLYDINVVNGNFGDFNSGNYGGIVTSFFYDVPAHAWSNYDFVDNTIWLDNLVDSIAPQTTAVLDRYRYPDMKVTGTNASTRVFYSVYDRLEDRIIYRTFRVGTDPGITGSTGGRVNNQGSALYTDIPQDDRDGNFPDYGGDNRFTGSNLAGRSPRAADGAVVTEFTPTSSFGEHTAIAATPDGSAVAMLYYDESGTGSLQYISNATPTNPAAWSAPLTIASSAGFEYLDMEIDSSGVVHIAYYDSYAGDVHYVRLPSYDSASHTNVVVDSYLIVGDKLSLTVDTAGTPYLAYKGIGNTARVAWPLAGTVEDGVDASSRYTGQW